MNATYFRSDAIKKLNDLSPQIAIHLVKLCCDPGDTHANGWQKEIEA